MMTDKVALAVKNRTKKPIRNRIWLFCHFLCLAFWSIFSTKAGVEVMASWVVYKRGQNDDV